MKLKRSYKIAIITTAVVVTLVVAVALLISPVAKNYIEKHSKELTGRIVKMDKLRFNIFNGKLHIENISMREADDSTKFASIDEYNMQIRLWPIIRHKVIINSVELKRPYVNLYQRGTQFNFDDLVEFFTSDSTEVDDSPSTWEVGIYNIALRGGRMSYKDLLLDASWGFNDLSLDIPGVYFSGKKTDVGLLLNFAEGGSLKTAIAYDINKSDYDLTLALKNFTLSGTLPYLRQWLNIDKVEGQLSADMHIKGNVNHLLDVQTSGTIGVRGFAMEDSSARKVVEVDSMGVNIIEGDITNMKYRLDNLYVNSFTTLFEINRDGTNNLTTLLKPTAPATAQQTDSVATATTPQLQIAKIEIADGRVKFTDNTTPRQFSYDISHISLNAKDFDINRRNSLTIDARMNRRGIAKIRWTGSLTDINNQNILVTLANVNLRDFSPYCEQYTAYPITGGNLTFRSQNIIKNRYLNGANHLDTYQFKVSKKLKGQKAEFNIPLRLGLYILTDKKEHINIDLPVKGNLDSLEFSYRKIVLKAIGNVLLKVVTAPFSFMFGGDQNLNFINIDALQFAFTSEQYASLDKLAQALKEKPGMKISLVQNIAWDNAVKQLSANNLKMAYYNHTTPIPADGQRLSMVDFDKIKEINFKSEEVIAFADSLLRVKGIEPTTLGNSDKPMRLYEDMAREQLTKIMAMRNNSLTEYMATTHGISAERLKITSADVNKLKANKSENRYNVAVEVDGESSSDANSVADTQGAEMAPTSTDIQGSTVSPVTPATTPFTGSPATDTPTDKPTDIAPAVSE